MLMRASLTTLKEPAKSHYPARHPLEHGDPFAGQRFDDEPPRFEDDWSEELRDCPLAPDEKGAADLQPAAA